MKQPKILCVDDEGGPLLMRQLVLQDAGFDVLTATDIDQAMEVFNSNKVELVVSDHLLDHGTGAELARRIKQLHPDVPFILLSGLVDRPDEAESVDAFVNKVEGRDVLIKTIKDLLADRAR